MPRYKAIDTQPKLLPVDLARQLLPGTFEHAVNYLLDHALDLSSFDERFHNDETGAPAYPPSMLLKVVLVAYAHGIVSSRGIERACRSRSSPAIARRMRCRPSPPSRRRSRSAVNGWSGTPRTFGTGSRRIPRTGTGPEARCVRAIARTTRARRWRRERA